ncbi:cupin domain-containing protein [Nocardiopsis synnemataformans]|uniref:cupin domain-containing protein n=1 Tax=Nocardiopsis synnemataformans TaxID=61305 RepID=UPI003EBA8158
MITVIRSADSTGAQPGRGTFTGDVWKDLLIRQDGIGVATIQFTPGARTNWHTHEGGQLLVIVAGEALVGDESGTELLAAGDIAWTPGGTPHWHGATDGRFMVHTAVSFQGVDWHGPVDERTYAAALQSARS